MSPEQNFQMKLQSRQRLALFGRLRMADWIEMPEGQFAAEIAALEKDPLFKRLVFGSQESPSVIRRQRWPRGRMAGSFYEVNEALARGGERVKVEEALGEKAELLPKIRKMGREAFERYFLHATEALPLDKIAERTGLTLADVEAIHELLLELGAQAEFSMPERVPAMSAYSCIARLSVSEGEPEFEFFSPHWARGVYQVRYDLLERWKDDGRLGGPERKRLPHLLKRIETVNLRQSTVFRILESLTKLQCEFLENREADRLRPVSLRQLSHRLDLAPSTVSRALSGRSVLMPWGKEQPLITLLPGRRRVVREVLSRWLSEAPRQTDAAIAQRLKDEYSIAVSRRTVNAVRHQLKDAA